MEWVETTGRTVEEAKDAALDQLGVDEQDAEFEIVEEPRFGLFGRLRSEARVRARVRPTKPRAKEERRDRRGRHRPSTSEAAPPATSDDASGGASARPARRPSERDGTAASSAARPSRPAAPAGTSAAGGSESDGGAHRDARRRRSTRPPTADTADDGAGEGDEAVSPRASTRSSSARTRSSRPANGEGNDDATTSAGGGMDVSLDEQGIVAREFLDGLVGRMTLEAEVTITQPEEDTIELNLEGPDLGLLIGPKGATLLAIQDLTRTVVQRKTSAANGRILVDVAGYRRKRKDALARFTRQVAEEVQTTGTRRVLEPMSAADRKIVHDTVNDIEGVETVSEGEDPQRRVVILPVSADT
jgi:spoIIIJ-associated protein